MVTEGDHFTWNTCSYGILFVSALSIYHVLLGVNYLMIIHDMIILHTTSCNNRLLQTGGFPSTGLNRTEPPAIILQSTYSEKNPIPHVLQMSITCHNMTLYNFSHTKLIMWFADLANSVQN